MKQSVFKIPVSILQTITRIQRNFLWGGKENSKKIAWVKWDSVCRSKTEGGLGVRELRVFNISLLSKWLWRWVKGDNSLWVRILKSRYGALGNCDGVRGTKHAQSIWWKDLNSVWNGVGGRVLRENIDFSLGDGNRALFWSDPWVERGTILKEKFSKLFALSAQKYCKVNEMGFTMNNRWVWELGWQRTFIVAEMIEFLEFWFLISRYKPDHLKADSFIWKRSEDGDFATKSMYNLLSKAMHDDVEVDPLLKKVWCKGVPSKVSSFIWKALRDRVPTKMNLINRRIIFDDRDKFCILCSTVQEDIDHLMCTCSFSYEIWQKCVGWLGFVMVGSNVLRSHFLQFPCFSGRPTMKKLLCIIWQCVCWSIWKVRNEVIFRGIRKDVDSVVEGIKFRSWKWIRSYFQSSFVYSFHDWCSNPSACCPTKLI